MSLTYGKDLIVHFAVGHPFKVVASRVGGGLSS
jgi:hypothetical protein